MKKEEVRNLEDEFSSVLRGQNHQQSLSQQSESNLLDSNEPSQKGTFQRVPLAQSESQDDFLDQIDDILDHSPDNQQLTRREIMLNFKLNELKLLCRNLKQANTKLAQRVEELERVCSQGESATQLNHTSDLSMMQQQFTEIEEQLSRYKQQLTRHQKQMDIQMNAKNEELRRVRQEAAQMRNARDSTERELRERSRIIKLLQQRNQELLLTIQELQAAQQSSIPQGSSLNQHFNEQISQQMQSMIDKLLKQLKYQKRISSNHLAEIKRLNSQIISMENKLKQKNNKIYQLELAAIKLNKTQHHQYNSPRKIDTDRLEPNTAYLPQRNFIGITIDNKNKTQASVRANKNRMSAERQGGTKHTPFLPLNKVFSTFTLMDLLNKEFKIRTAEKYFIASRVVELYADKLNRGDYDNLIPEEIEIYNFSSQAPAQLRVRVNAVSRSDRYEANEESLLYNMAFVLDTLLNQVQVVDAYLGTILELNIPDYIQLVLGKPSKEEKQKLLIQLATTIERQYLTD